MKDSKWAMLCRLRVEAFNDPNWAWERKLDGGRMRLDYDPVTGVRLIARSGADKTAQFPEFAGLRLACRGVFDTELVSAQGLGFQEFNQRRMNRQESIEQFAKEMPAKLVLFDVLWHGGHDVRPESLAERRLFIESHKWPFGIEVSQQYEDGVALFERANREGWEGVVGKRLDEPYFPNKRAWVKVKRWLDGVFLVIGFTGGTGKRKNMFGSMMLGKMGGDGRVRHVCDCGSGPDDAELYRLDELRKTTLPYCMMKPGEKTGETYDGPSLLRVRVKYVEETNAGSLRFPIYLGTVGQEEAGWLT